MAMGDNQRGWTMTLVPHAKMRTVALDNPNYGSHLTVSPEDPPDPGLLSDMGTERLTSYMTPIDPSALLKSCQFLLLVPWILSFVSYKAQRHKRCLYFEF